MSLKPHDPWVTRGDALAAPVHLRQVTGPMLRQHADMVAVLAFADDWCKTPVFYGLDKAFGGAVRTAAKEEGFTAKNRQRLQLNLVGAGPTKRLLWVGLGAQAEASYETLLHGAALATRAATKVGAKRLALAVPHFGEAPASTLAAVARGAGLGVYRIKKPKAERVQKPKPPLSVDIVLAAGAAVPKSESYLHQVNVVTAATHLARDWGNESAATLYPETLAERARLLAARESLRVKVMTPDELAEANLNLLLAVGQGSPRAPRLVHISYRPKAPQAHLALVGKGITFDSGGLCLKPPSSMLEMRMDMGGAATAFASTLAAARLKLPVDIDCVLALAENMPSGTALKLGDVIRGAAGKTVEVGNTDAEGRLILADALHFALALKPDAVIDIATLTGAIAVALGPTVAGLFANHDALAELLLKSAAVSGEGFWRLPLLPALKEELKSEFADLKNTADRHGGAISAALFLKEFVGQTPWAHLDIAGPGICSKEDGAFTKGGSGFGVATLVAFLANPELLKALARGKVAW